MLGYTCRGGAHLYGSKPLLRPMSCSLDDTRESPTCLPPRPRCPLPVKALWLCAQILHHSRWLWWAEQPPRHLQGVHRAQANLVMFPMFNIGSPQPLPAISSSGPAEVRHHSVRKGSVRCCTSSGVPVQRDLGRDLGDLRRGVCRF